MKRLLIIIVVMFSMLPLSVQKTQAYWAEDVLFNEVNYSKVIAIGEWTFSIQWEEGQSYVEGTIVEYNGELYIRTNRGSDTLAGIFSPDSWLGWIFWQEN